MKTFDTFTDEMLVSSYAKGNNAAFEELLCRHKDKVFSYIYSITHNRELTEDIFQETFVKAIVTIKQGNYTEHGKFAAWISRIAHNLVIDFYRKEANQNTCSNDSYDYDLLNNSELCEQHIEDVMIYEQTIEDMVGLIELLPENQQEIVKLRFYDDLSFKEIAEKVDISINTALGRMRYAVLNLRKLATQRNLLKDFEKIS